MGIRISSDFKSEFYKSYVNLNCTLCSEPSLLLLLDDHMISFTSSKCVCPACGSVSSTAVKHSRAAVCVRLRVCVCLRVPGRAEVAQWHLRRSEPELPEACREEPPPPSRSCCCQRCSLVASGVRNRAPNPATSFWSWPTTRTFYWEDWWGDTKK